jgi:hypothetical protein
MFRAVTPPAPPAPPATEVPRTIRRGLAYHCRRCDVYGYFGPDDQQACWSCEEADALGGR